MAWPQELTGLKKVRRQCRLEYWLAGLFFLAAAGLAGYAAGVLAAAPWAGLGPWRWLFSLGAVLAGAVILFIKRPDDLAIARRLDRDLNSRERIQTLVEYQGREGDMLAMLRQEAGAYFRENPPVYRAERRRFFLPAALSLAAIVLVVVAMIIAPGLARSFNQLRELKELRQETAEELEEIIAELPQDDPLLEGIREQLEDLVRQALEAQTPEEMELLLREARELLEAETRELESLAAALKGLEDLMQGMSPQELARAAAGDPQFAGELAQRLDDLAEALPDRFEDLGDMLRQLAADPAAAQPGQWQELVQRLSGLDAQAAQSALAQAGQVADGTPGEENTPGQGSGEGSGEGSGSEGPGQGSGEGSGEGSGQGSGEGSGEGSGQGSGEGSGEGSGQGSGEGPGQGSGEGQGASPVGSGASPHQFVYIPGQGEFSLGGEGDGGEYTLRDLLRIDPGLGQDYGNYFSGYRQRALGSLGRGEIPRQLEDYVRSYFEAIAPQGGN
ncbi:MAG: hypothetical protein GX090_01385 [Firmicutes bacterium]|nr:hypothetical protein [Bacillota bacterium]